MHRKECVIDLFGIKKEEPIYERDSLKYEIGGVEDQRAKIIHLLNGI